MNRQLVMTLTLFVCFLISTQIQSATPLGTGFTYQGRYDQDGIPGTGPLFLRFSLWDAEMDGAQLGASQRIHNVPVTDGVFSVTLNASGEFGADAFNGDARWLQIEECPGGSCESPDPFSPRQPLSAAPYAQNALSAPWSGLSDIPSGFADGIDNSGDSLWGSNGANVFYNGGNVGIGTSNPTSALEIAAQDGLAITGYQPYLTLRDTNAGGARGIIAGGNGDFGFYTNDTIAGLPLVIFRNNTNNVGIGTSSPNPSTRLNVLTNANANQAVRGDAPNGNGVVGTNAREGYAATAGINSGNQGVGIYGEANMGLLARGVWGRADGGSGVYRTCNSAQGTESAGVLGRNTANDGSGVIGEANAGGLAIGVWGQSAEGRGVYGEGTIGVEAVKGPGVGYALYAHGGGYSRFDDNVDVIGQLHVLGGLVDDKSNSAVRMDHPLDPANKYLSHTSVESSDMMNLYNGTVTTDERGYATVVMPDWFESFNRDVRYQLTVLDDNDSDDFVQVKVVKKIKANRFTIRTSQPIVEVSWQVTGVRNDAWANANPLEVEKGKAEEDRGKYLAPELYGQPKEAGIHYRPEIEPPTGKVSRGR